MVDNNQYTDIQLDNRKRVRDFRVLSAKRYIFINNALQGLGIYEAYEAKDCKREKW